jgi:transcriptional regulator GlxA family with amidase domain
MLVPGAHTMAEIARETGFSNINSFYKAFKRVYGFPPGKVAKKK